MYNIKSVAKMLDMPAVTIRAWERRYSVVTPTRSESGHRLYSEQDIDDLRWLKIQTEEKGINISQAVKMLKNMRDQRDEGTPKPERQIDKSFEGIRGHLYEALIAFDAEQAQSVVSLGFSMFAYEDIFHQVFAPVLVRIGDEWEIGNVSVAQEHFASQFLTQRFHQFFNVFPVNQMLPKAIAFCPAEEQHQMGLLLFTLFLRRNGMEVLYLGPNTPENGVVAMIERHDVKIVAMSLTNPEQMDAVAQLIERLSTRLPTLKFVVGGKGFADLPPELEQWALEGELTVWQAWFARVTQRFALRNGV